MGKYNWETAEEAKFRNEMSELSKRIGVALSGMSTYAKELKYKPGLDLIRKEYEILKKAKAPDKYVNPMNLHFEGVSYYLKGFKILVENIDEVENVKDVKTNVIAKATECIDAGNCYSKITRIKLTEILEANQKSYEAMHARKYNKGKT